MINILKYSQSDIDKKVPKRSLGQYQELIITRIEGNVYHALCPFNGHEPKLFQSEVGKRRVEDKWATFQVGQGMRSLPSPCLLRRDSYEG